MVSSNNAADPSLVHRAVLVGRRVVCGLAILSTVPSQTPTAAPQWFGDPFAAVLARARIERRQVAMYFWAAGSTHCASLWNETLSAGPAATELAELVCYSADVGRTEPAALLGSYGVQVLPTVLILDSQGRVEDVLEGHLPTAEFLLQLRRIRIGVGTVGALRAAATASPDDLELRFVLALKLRDVGDRRQAEGLFESIRGADPEGETVGGAELLLLAATDAAAREARDSGSPADPARLREVLSRLHVPSVRAKAWNAIARIERQRGRSRAALEALKQAWAELPPVGQVDQVVNLAFAYWELRAEVEAGDAGFLVEALQQSADAARDRARAGAAEDTDDLTLRAHACAAALAGRGDEALESVELALQLAPDDAELQALRRAIVDSGR